MRQDARIAWLDLYAQSSNEPNFSLAFSRTWRVDVQLGLNGETHESVAMTGVKRGGQLEEDGRSSMSNALSESRMNFAFLPSKSTSVPP